jgi:hypothetical protein
MAPSRTLILMLFLFVQGGSAQKETGTGIFTFQVFSSFGDPLSQAGERVDVEMIGEADSARKTLARGLKSNEASPPLPYGTYRITAATPGFLPQERIVRLSRPKQWVAIGLPVQLGDTEGTPMGALTIEVTVLSTRTRRRPYFIKLVSAYGTVGGESLLRNSQNHRFERLYMGIYVLLVFDRDDLVAAQAIDIDEKIPLVRAQIKGSEVMVMQPE